MIDGDDPTIYHLSYTFINNIEIESTAQHKQLTSRYCLGVLDTAGDEHMAGAGSFSIVQHGGKPNGWLSYMSQDVNQ